MTHLLYIQQVQSVTGAVVTIVALLIVAAIIGYFSAWFYAKSVYTPVIKGLEADKVELNKQIAGLKDDITKLNTSVDNLKSKIASLEKEVVLRDKQIDELKNPKK